MGMMPCSLQHQVRVVRIPSASRSRCSLARCASAARKEGGRLPDRTTEVRAEVRAEVRVEGRAEGRAEGVVCRGRGGFSGGRPWKASTEAVVTTRMPCSYFAAWTTWRR